MNKQDILNFIGSLTGIIDDDKIDLFKKIVDDRCFDVISDVEEFELGLIYPYEQFLEGMLKTVMNANDDVMFLYINHSFIECHFDYWIKRLDGYACHADKSRTIINSLIDFYTDGTIIEFNQEQEVTYHLPVNVFVSHDEIINFYVSLKYLKFGDPVRYLEQVKNIFDKLIRD